MNCLACGYDKFSKVISFKNDRINVLKCNQCGLVRLDPLEINNSYRDDYKDYSDEMLYDYFIKLRTPQHLNDLEIIKRYKQNGKLLDVGSSYGIFLDLAVKSGFVAHGIEPAETAVNFCKTKYPDLKVHTAELESIKLIDKFDIITIWSTLEHTLNPELILNICNSLMNNDGLLCIRVPDYSGLLVKLIILSHKLSFGKIDSPSKSLFQIPFIYKHFYFFSIKNLEILLNKTGFNILHFYRENSLNYNYLKDREMLSDNINDVDFMKNPFISFAVKLILKTSNILKMQDELVVFAKKIT